MVAPVRCFTCGSVIAHLHAPLSDIIARCGFASDAQMSAIGLRKLCCRQMLLTHVEVDADKHCHNQFVRDDNKNEDDG